MAVRLHADIATGGRRIPPLFEFDPDEEWTFTHDRIIADGGTIGSAAIAQRWIADSIADGSYPYVFFDGAPIIGYKLVGGFVEKVYSIGRTPTDAVRDVTGGSASVPLDTSSFSYPIVLLDGAHTFRLPSAPRGSMHAIIAVDGNAPAYNAGIFLDTSTGTTHEQFFAAATISSLETGSGRVDSSSLQGVTGFTTFAALDSAFGILDPVRGRMMVGRNGVIGNHGAYTPLAFTSGSGDIQISGDPAFKWVELAFLSGAPDIATIKARSLSGFQRNRT